MKFVEIYKLQNDGSQRVVMVCTLTEKGAVCGGDAVFVENVTHEGVLDHTTNPPERLYPKDGLRFLEVLKFTFKSGYLNASEVKEG